MISEFDPWRSVFCTCPSKLTFNPYTGCDHACVYCYASSYIPHFFKCRPKRDLITKLKREATKLKGETISISNSSDPYPNLETKLRLTRQCLEVLSKSNCKIQIITKSDIVTRDIDLLKRVPSMVSVTVTTDNDQIAKIIEPNAPPSSKRLKAIETLIQAEIPTTVRLDPIIPFINDNPEKLVANLATIGVKHLTSSTYKMKPDNWQRLSKVLPETAEKLKPLYFENGEKIGRTVFLSKTLRLQLMAKVKVLADKHGMRFGTCREGLSQLNTATCDGSWLLRESVSELF